MLFAAVLFFIVTLSVVFSSAVFYRLSHLQRSAQALNNQSLAVSLAGQAMLADLSRMHDLMLQTILAPHASTPGQVSTTLQALDGDLRHDVAVVSAESAEFQGARDAVTRQLDGWHATHGRILDLIRNNRMNQALALGMNSGVHGYSMLDASMGALAQQVRAHAAALAEAAAGKEDEAVREAWWMLGALALFNALCGVVVIRRIRVILKDDARLVARLHEDEQRLKMALSGGNQGTWDLDVTTGKLNFDAQWGNLLSYQDKRDRPASMEQWAARIFGEDRERVLKAMQDHIEGRVPEYRAEYRMRSGDGELRWVAGRGKAMQRDANGKATRVVGITQDITQRKLSEQKIWNLAHTDLLTGLPNRVLLYDRLTQMLAYAKRRGKMFALLFLDLDGFKAVNDQFGHDVGDQLLQEVAGRLSAAIRSEDTLARVGGDEFIFLLSTIHAREDAAIVSDKILALLRQDFVIDDHVCRIGGSIGVAVFPDHSDTMDALVSCADDAMYQAKAKGKNNFQFFEPA